MPELVQQAILSAYIASIGKRTPREAAHDAAELVVWHEHYTG